jgi:hypothetical protein
MAHDLGLFPRIPVGAERVRHLPEIEVYVVDERRGTSCWPTRPEALGSNGGVRSWIVPSTCAASCGFDVKSSRARSSSRTSSGCLRMGSTGNRRGSKRVASR